MPRIIWTRSAVKSDGVIPIVSYVPISDGEILGLLLMNDLVWDL